VATLLVPPLDEEPWPTLGDEVADWIEEHGRYGPGERVGEPYEVTPEFRAQLQRAYEVHPKGSRLAGRRRFKRCYLEERKGTAKTERAMLVAFAESHPDAPVRCDGFDAHGNPVGIGVKSPYIPLMSYTVEQTEDLGFNVLRSIIEESDLAGDYDIGLERIVLLDKRGGQAGKIVPLAGSPAARDGARTTFQHFDEPHRMVLLRLMKAHTTMVENTYKRVGADPWTFYTSTAGDLGEESVARDIREYAEDIDRGDVEDPSLFFFSRFAPLDMPLETPEQVREYLLEASGPNASWSGDIDGLVSRWFEPKTDRPYYRRVWGNQWWSGAGRAVDAAQWADLARPKESVPGGTTITIGFDGSLSGDHTGIIGTVVATGHQFLIDHWAPTEDTPVDRVAVDAAMTAAFERYDVWRAYCDPYRWEDQLATWEGRWPRRVISWSTAAPKMGDAVRLWRSAITSSDLTHDGDSTFAQHVRNAFLEKTRWTDDDGQPLHHLVKERKWSPNKIDLAVCAVLSWEARRDAVAAGITGQHKRRRPAVFI